MDLIKELKETGLVGLGGAGYPTWQKWQTVKNAPGNKKFVICNLSEGEPGVFKDEYLLKHHMPDLVISIETAASTVGAIRSYIFINDKYKKYIPALKRLSDGKKIEIFIDTGRYLCGEETTLLQLMERKIRQPRQKPPYPAERGLWQYPTLINNAETLYRALLVSQGNKKQERYYSVSVDGKPINITEAKIGAKISDIISEKSLSSVNFFRVGGVSGIFVKSDQIETEISGNGAIEIFTKKNKIVDALSESINFFVNESCGKCTPCREGSYRLAQELNALSDRSVFFEKNDNVENLKLLAENAELCSFCGLGKSISRPVLSAIIDFRSELLNE